MGEEQGLILHGAAAPPLYPVEPLSFAQTLYLEERTDRVVVNRVFGQRYVQVNVIAAVPAPFALAGVA